MPITLGILTTFCVLAYITNHIIDYNYMFLMRGDGTPYDIIFNIVGGNPVIYPLTVVGLFFVYILSFYKIFFLVSSKASRKEASEAEETPVTEESVA